MAGFLSWNNPYKDLKYTDGEAGIKYYQKTPQEFIYHFTDQCNTGVVYAWSAWTVTA